VKYTLEARVNSIFLTAIAGVAIMAAASEPSLAQNQPSADVPVSIASCNVVPTFAPTISSDGNVPSSPTGSDVWISFENRSPRTITEVTFLLETPGGAVTVTDQGRFSSGVPIRKILGPFADLQGDETCALYSVRFEDGAVWHRT
jgi:hypothetical protein